MPRTLLCHLLCDQESGKTHISCFIFEIVDHYRATAKKGASYIEFIRSPHGITAHMGTSLCLVLQLQGCARKISQWCCAGRSQINTVEMQGHWLTKKQGLVSEPCESLLDHHQQAHGSAATASISETATIFSRTPLCVRVCSQMLVAWSADKNSSLFVWMSNLQVLMPSVVLRYLLRIQASHSDYETKTFAARARYCAF